MIPSASDLHQEKRFAYFCAIGNVSPNKTNVYLDLVCRRNSQPSYCPGVT